MWKTVSKMHNIRINLLIRISTTLTKSFRKKDFLKKKILATINATGKGKKRFFKKKNFRVEGYTNNPKYFGNTETNENDKKNFNFKKGKKRFKNRSRPKYLNLHNRSKS